MSRGNCIESPLERGTSGFRLPLSKGVGGIKISKRSIDNHRFFWIQLIAANMNHQLPVVTHLAMLPHIDTLPNTQN
jgi:hypothetical protein